MDMDRYQEQALRTAGDKCKGSRAYSMGGVGGEAGEYVDVVKKHLFHDVPEDKSRPLALKELGDLLWGVAQAADSWGLSLSDVATANLDKLRTSYPSGFTAAASVARVDEKTPEQEAHAGQKCWSSGALEYAGRCNANHDGYLCTRLAGHRWDHLASNGTSIARRWRHDDETTVPAGVPL